MKLKHPTKPLTIPFDDQKLKVVYVVRHVKLKDLLDPPDPADQRSVVTFMADQLAKRLVSWDLEDDGGPVGTSVSDILEQPPELVRAVLEAINADGAPGEATGSN